MSQSKGTLRSFARMFFMGKTVNYQAYGVFWLRFLRADHDQSWDFGWSFCLQSVHRKCVFLRFTTRNVTRCKYELILLTQCLGTISSWKDVTNAAMVGFPSRKGDHRNNVSNDTGNASAEAKSRSKAVGLFSEKNCFHGCKTCHNPIAISARQGHQNVIVMVQDPVGWWALHVKDCWSW